MSVQEDNHTIFHRMSVFLNLEARAITPRLMRDMCEGIDISAEDAYRMLVAGIAVFNITEEGRDSMLYRRYFPYMIHRLDPADFRCDPYLTTFRLPARRVGTWEFREECYQPYEAFACDDPVTMFDGRVIPQIGFFEEKFTFPAVLERGREWMTITPNEMTTMREPIAAARGHVLTFGLGLGYYAFMAARREEVEQVTVVECSAEVIRLYREYIEPQNPHADKINIIQADAFDFARERMASGGYDVVFVDIWHDPTDGVKAYQRMKQYEKLLPTAEFHYWIERTLQLYM